MKIQLTQQIVVSNKSNKFAQLDELCFLSKNLYNVALYHIRQYYKETGKYLSYNKLAKMLSDSNNIDYRAMPYAQSAQQVLRQVDNQYKAFYVSIKSKKMQGKKVRLPKYKDKENGRNIFVYTNQGAKVSNGIVYLKTKQGKLSFKTVADKIQQVRLVPKANHIVVEIIYNKECEAKQDNNRYASIDLGLNNLCTLTSNATQSIILNGKPLKSINQHYNKTKAKLQSKLSNNKHTSKRISRLTLRRNRKIKDYMHKVSRKIVEYMEANSFNTLFVGKNVGWKDSINLGRINNQNFVSIPYNMLVQMLEYKCKLAGINFVIVNEAYTSKCSFLDREKISKHDSYAGRRIKRGLFISSSGILINADVNGSLNIMRLGLEKQNVKLDVVEEILRPENKRFVFNPVKICA